MGRGAAKRPAAAAAGGATSVSRAAYGLVKLAGLIVGGSAALICLSALAALLHPSPYVRLPLALFVGLILPWGVLSRLLPDALERKTEGLTTDGLAVGWSAVAFLVAGVLHAQSRPWLEAEAARLDRELGGTVVGAAARWLAGLSTSPRSAAGTGDDATGAGGATQSPGASTHHATAATGGAPPRSSPPTAGSGGPPARGDGGVGGAPPEAAVSGGQGGSATAGSRDASARPATDAPPSDGAGGGTAEPTLDWRSIEDALSASLVTVAVGTRTGVRSLTGVCVGQPGQVVTAYQPMAAARAMAVRQPDGFWVRGGARIDADPGHDLALLRVRGADAMRPLLLPVATPRSPARPRSARCIASPLGLGLTQVDVSVRASSGPDPSWVATPLGRRRCDPGSLVVELTGGFFGIAPSEPLWPSGGDVVRLTNADAVSALVGATRRPAPLPVPALDPGELW